MLLVVNDKCRLQDKRQERSEQVNWAIDSTVFLEKCMVEIIE
jgi:hypothetical protein